MDEIQLRVAESAQPDVGKGIARIDPKDRQKLDLKPGDVIELEAKRKTAAVVVEAYQTDFGLGIIRIDGMTRRNSGTSIGESVTIKKAEVKEAKKVVFAPAEKGIRFMVPPNVVLKNMMGRVITKGDLVTPVAPRRRKDNNMVFGILGDIEEFFGAPMSLSGDTKLIVSNTTPKGILRISSGTEVELLPEAREDVETVPDIAYEDIGGLKNEIQSVREMIELPLKHPELFHKLGIDPPKGVLLRGPPGTGKTLIAKAVANESDAYFINVAGPEIMGKFYGESEKRLREMFKDAEANSPSIIFIDEIDAMAPKREEVSGEVERRVVAQLLSLMDGLKSRGKIMVIGATNRPNALDPALRRPGRFDREIEIGVPSKEGRYEILQIHTRNMPLHENVNLEDISKITHGFVGADLAALCRESAMKTLRRFLPEINLEEDTISPEILEKLYVTKEDFENALKLIEPSALREVLVQIPNIKWENIGGLNKVKQQLRESIEWPIKYPDSFKRIRIQPPKGVLLFGPPGTGKTLLAKAVASESEANFIAIKGPELLSKWVGESEKAVREVFRKAREAAPCVIFFDEVDAIAPSRGGLHGDSKSTERVISQLLTELDGLVPLEHVIVVAATNRPDIIDNALLRPGRFDRQLYVPAPDEESRLEIFKVHTKDMPLEGVNLEDLAKKANNFSGADIEALCREAGMLALRENLDAQKITNKNFDEAFGSIRPSITQNIVDSYERIANSFGRAKFKEESLDYTA